MFCVVSLNMLCVVLVQVLAEMEALTFSNFFQWMFFSGLYYKQLIMFIWSIEIMFVNTFLSQLTPQEFKHKFCRFCTENSILTWSISQTSDYDFVYKIYLSGHWSGVANSASEAEIHCTVPERNFKCIWIIPSQNNIFYPTNYSSQINLMPFIHPSAMQHFTYNPYSEITESKLIVHPDYVIGTD